jgi:hypothetical protein
MSTGTLATIIISLFVLLAVVLAIRSVVCSRRSGGCDACGDSASCSACKPSFDVKSLDDRPPSRDRSGVANH